MVGAQELLQWAPYCILLSALWPVCFQSFCSDTLCQYTLPRILRVLDRASSWYLNKGRPTWWQSLYYVNLLFNMFRMLIHPSSGACDYLVRYCLGCIVLTWGVLVLCSGIGCWLLQYYSSGSACTRIPHHQQPIPLHNTNTPQVSTIQPKQ